MSTFSTSSYAPDIPIIDLSLPDTQLNAIVHKACIEHGFFLITNHGVDRSLIKQTFDISKQFFALDSSIKQKYSAHNQPINASSSSQEKADSSLLGYTQPFDEKLDPTKQKIGNTQEGYYMGREDQTNQFPDNELPDFKQITTSYHNEMTRVAMRLVDLIWSSLHAYQPADQSTNPSDDSIVEVSHWRNYFDKPSAILRFLHYLPQMPSDEKDGRFGAGSHTDWDFLTILATESASDEDSTIDRSNVRSNERGLQIYQTGQWFDVPLVRGAFVVNLADMLQRWTNDVYRSTVHRVIIHSTSDRYSIPFFFGPNSETMVKVLASCQSVDRPVRYQPICSGEYLQERYRQTQKPRQQPSGIGFFQ